MNEHRWSKTPQPVPVIKRVRELQSLACTCDFLTVLVRKTNLFLDLLVLYQIAINFNEPSLNTYDVPGSKGCPVKGE